MPLGGTGAVVVPDREEVQPYDVVGAGGRAQTFAFNKNIKEIARGNAKGTSGNAQEILDRVYDYYQRAENVVGDVLLTDKVLARW